MGEGVERCELCGAPAAVHCPADAAFLCAACDARVHGANFLASRHTRRRLAVACAARYEPAEDEEGYASAASSCVSTAADSSLTTAATARERRRRGGRAAGTPAGRPRRVHGAEAVLEGWAERMGLAAGEARRCAAAAGRALRTCGPDVVAVSRVPLRVAMAAALWREVVAGSGAGVARGDALRRLEACAHVPARLVVAVAASMMARARARRRAAVVALEGWDECSSVEPKSSPARS